MEKIRDHEPKYAGREEAKADSKQAKVFNSDSNEVEESKDKSMVDELIEGLRQQAKHNVVCDAEELILQSSFARWREEAFERLSGTFGSLSPRGIQLQVLDFAMKVDYGLLPGFAQQIRGQYAEIVNLHHFGLDIESIRLLDGKQKNVHSKLVRAVCKWLLNVELAVDLTRRLKLYNVIDYTGVNVLQKCKSKLKPTQKSPMRHMLKVCSWNLALHIQEKLGSTFLRLAGAFALCKIPLNYSFGLGLLRSLVTGTALAKILVLPVAGYCFLPLLASCALFVISSCD